MVKVQHFSENLEREVSNLGETVERIQSEPSNEELTEREVVKQTLKQISQATPAPREEPKPNRPQPQAQDTTNVPNYLASQTNDPGATDRVNRLVNLVFEGSLEHALKEAKKESPFVEDAFHDALIDKLLPKLKEKGIIK